MPDPNETGQKGGQDVREQARAEIKKKIEEAEKSSNPDQAKEELGERLARQLKDVSEEAKEVVENEEKAKKGEEVFAKENEKKDVAAKVIKVLEAAKKGVTVAKTEKGQVFLEEIAAEIPSPSLSQCNQLASYLTPYLLGEKDIVINPPDQSESEFQQDFKALTQVNPELAKKVKKVLLKAAKEGKMGDLSEEAIEKGLLIPSTSPEIPREKEGEQNNQNNKDNISDEKQLQELKKRFTTTFTNFLQTVDHLSLEDRLRPGIEEEIKGQLSPKLEPEDIQKFVDLTLSDRAKTIRGELITGFNKIISASGKKDLDEATLDLVNKINDLQNKNYLSDEEAKNLIELISQVKEIKDVRERFISNLKFTDAERELAYFRIQLTSQSEEVAKALFSTENFIEFLKKRGYLGDDGKLTEGAFIDLYNAIRDLFEEIISTVDSKPGQYFDTAFNYMYEGTYYNLLIQRLRKIGVELRQSYPQLAESEILVDDPRFLRYAYDSEKGAERRMLYSGGQRRESFDWTMGIMLAQDMSRLLSIHRAFYNIEYIVEIGAGFEELAKYIEQISYSEITWLLRTTPEVVESYNLYTSNIIEELSLNNWVVPTSFGHKDRENLNYAQRLTLYQLLARKETSDDLREFYKTARRVKMASALSILNGEFWRILMTSRFLVVLKEESGQGKIEYIYTGAQHSGVEKMLAEIDWITSLQRFNLPAEHPLMNLVYIPRDITKAQYQRWDHRRLSEINEQIENAMVFGPTEKILHFLEENRVIGEVLRQPTLNILDRGGWRVEEYKVFLRKTASGKIDFDASMSNLAMVGTPAIKAFIDGLKFEDVDLETIDGNDLKAIEEKNKDYLIERYIFERTLKMRPSRVLTLEKRLYTPREERLVIDELIEYFRQKYGLDAHLIKDKILPLFLGGLRLAEDIIYQEKHSQAKRQYYQGNVPDQELIFYELKPEDLKPNSKVIESLERFYDSVIDKYLGIERNYQGRTINFRELIKKEEFLDTIADFLSKIKDGIDLKRSKVSADKKGEKSKGILPKRFANWLKLGILSAEINNGEDLDYGEFLISQAGRRVSARAYSDAVLNAKKIVPNYWKIFDGLATLLVKKPFGDAKAAEEFAEKHLIPLVQSIRDTLISYAGKETKDKAALELMMLLERCVGRDHDTRTLFWGDLIMLLKRNWLGYQGSLMQDAHPWRWERPTYVPNIDQMYTLARTIFNVMDVPFDEKKIVGYKKRGLFSVPIIEKHKYHVGQYKKIQGHTGWQRLKEKFIPLGVLIAFLIIIQLFREAQKKNKEK